MMTRRIGAFLILSAICVGSAAFAEDKYYIQDTSEKTEAKAEEVTKGYVSNEAVGIKPWGGVVDTTYTDNGGIGDSRLAGGLGLDFNTTRLVSESPTLYFGPSTGLIYSRLGGNNFVGEAGGRSFDMFLVPANLKLGVHLGPAVRLSAHGGGNVAYFSGAGIRSGAGWTAYPNAGADFEVGMGNHTSLVIRPDWSFTGGETIFAGMVGLGILLG